MVYPPRPWPLPDGTAVADYETNPVCPKCESEDVNQKYHDPADKSVLFSKSCDDMDRDHLHNSCDCCGYKWLMEVADFDNDEYQRRKNPDLAPTDDDQEPEPAEEPEAPALDVLPAVQSPKKSFLNMFR